MEYRKLFDPLIKDVEGFDKDPYMDQNNNATVGTGLNLEDPDVQGLMNLRNINPEEVKSGQRKLASEELDDIHNSYLDKREKLVRDKLGGDLYDTLQPHEKASIMSMGYQSLNNIGPNLTQSIAGGDKIGAIREMILNTNKDKDPGIAVRRFKEAETYGGPLDFGLSFKTLEPEQKQQLLDMIGKIKNENTRAEVLKKYGPYLQEKPNLGRIADLLKN